MTRAERPEYILLEASGVAEPSGIALTFMDEGLRDRIRLDSIMCVMDAEQIFAAPEMMELKLRQVAFADMLILNKVDLVAPEEIERTRPGSTTVSIAIGLSRHPAERAAGVIHSAEEPGRRVILQVVGKRVDIAVGCDGTAVNHGPGSSPSGRMMEWMELRCTRPSTDVVMQRRRCRRSLPTEGRSPWFRGGFRPMRGRRGPPVRSVGSRQEPAPMLKHFWFAAAFATVLAASAPALAQEVNEGWKVSLTGYVWAPGYDNDVKDSVTGQTSETSTRLHQLDRRRALGPRDREGGRPVQSRRRHRRPDLPAAVAKPDDQPPDPRPDQEEADVTTTTATVAGFYRRTRPTS